MSIFRDPPQPPDLRASAQAAVREHLLRKLRWCYVDPDIAIQAEAETIFMDNARLLAYVDLCEINNIHHETAATLVQRTPVEHLQECVRQLTEAAA